MWNFITIVIVLGVAIVVYLYFHSRKAHTLAKKAQADATSALARIESMTKKPVDRPSDPKSTS